jgi:CRISPR/Cas system-associated endonuclease Cas1
MQTLYLEKKSGVTITRDGPALIVASEGEAVRLFPLARLGRVVLHKSAEISSRVLIECAQAGVVFCFTDKRQNPIAWCLRQKDNGSNMGSAWREFIGRTDWNEYFSQWRKRQLEKALKQVVVSLKIDAEGRELSQLMNIIEHWVCVLPGRFQQT